MHPTQAQRLKGLDRIRPSLAEVPAEPVDGRGRLAAGAASAATNCSSSITAVCRATRPARTSSGSKVQRRTSCNQLLGVDGLGIKARCGLGETSSREGVALRPAGGGRPAGTTAACAWCDEQGLTLALGRDRQLAGRKVGEGRQAWPSAEGDSARSVRSRRSAENAH